MQRPAGHADAGASPWPGWAVDQLADAVAVAAGTPAGTGVAAHLYRTWFSVPLRGLDQLRPARYGVPLAGVYRAAHVGAGRRVQLGGMELVDRHDVVGTDGWWRTWGRHWTPPRQRRGSARIVLTPRPDRLAAVVRLLTGALLDADEPWSLACATSARRIRRCAAVIVDVPSAATLPESLVAELEPVLRPEVPPLCLRLGTGIALASHPVNGMTFGEHRCHLIATALRRPGAADEPLPAIARVFAAHGIDPAQPHRYAR